jgi:multiple sugar transport system permease protein
MIIFVIVALMSILYFYLLRDKDAAKLKKEMRAARRADKLERKGAA